MSCVWNDLHFVKLLHYKELWEICILLLTKITAFCFTIYVVALISVGYHTADLSDNGCLTIL